VKAIVVPTINVPTNLTEWATQLDPDHDIIVVVGSQKTPHDAVESFIETLPVPTEYMHPDAPVSTQWKTSALLERNHHHRRNLGVLQALSYGKTLMEPLELLITIDDDNYPLTPRWVDIASRLLAEPNTRQVVHSEVGWWNAGLLCNPTVTHRGFPIGLRSHDIQGIKSEYLDPRGERIGVVAGLWKGDPDIDAIERIALNPQVRYVSASVTLEARTWCPFDSQSTVLAGDLTPMLCMWTSVGRYDDIWASYLLRAVMDPLGWHVTYGYPLVRQDRNKHDLLKDLAAETYGMQHTERLCSELREISAEIKTSVENGDGATSPWQYFKYAVARVSDVCYWLPERTINTLQVWCDDVDEIGVD
jgi:reversibly glycosylated polypeptide